MSVEVEKERLERIALSVMSGMMLSPTLRINGGSPSDLVKTSVLVALDLMEEIDSVVERWRAEEREAEDEIPF